MAVCAEYSCSLKAKYYFTVQLSMYTCKEPWYTALVAYETFRSEHSYSQKNNCYQPLWYAGFWVQITGQLNVPWVNDRRLTSSLYSHSYRLFIVKDAPDFSLSPVSLQNMKTRDEHVTVKIGLQIPRSTFLPEAPQMPNNFFAFHRTGRFTMEWTV